MFHEDEARINLKILREAIASKENLKSEDVVGDLSYEISMGSNKGDNFTCTLFALEIKALVSGEKKEYNFIAKVIPIDPTRTAFVKHSEFMLSEVYFYSKIAPDLRSFANENPEFDIFFPECYYADVEEGVIIFDNLKHCGYKMADRKLGLNEEQIGILFKKMAQYHALAYHYIAKRGPEGLENNGILRNTWLKKNPVTTSIEAFINSSCKELSNVCAKAGEKDLAEGLKSFYEKKSPVDHIDEFCSQKQKMFRVVVHGDAWMNNFLFKYGEDGKIENMGAVDFQVIRVGSPTQDLAHTLFSSTDPELRESKCDSWLDDYYLHFSQNLKSLNYDPSTIWPKDAFLEDFQEARKYGFIIATFMSLGVVTDEAKDGGSLDPDNLKGQDLDETMYSDDSIKQSVQNNTVLIRRWIDLAKEAKKHDVF